MSIFSRSTRACPSAAVTSAYGCMDMLPMLRFLYLAIVTLVRVAARLCARVCGGGGEGGGRGVRGVEGWEG